MSAAAIMNAIATIGTTGTTIAQVQIEKGISLDAQPDSTPAFPALQINCPDVRGERKGIGPQGPYEPILMIHLLYIDRAEASDRPYETALADADATLDQVLTNVFGNIKLSTGGVDHCMEVGPSYRKHLDKVPTDIGLGFPTINGYLVIEVKDFWVQFTQS